MALNERSPKRSNTGGSTIGGADAEALLERVAEKAASKAISAAAEAVVEKALQKFEGKVANLVEKGTAASEERMTIEVNEMGTRLEERVKEASSTRSLVSSVTGRVGVGFQQQQDERIFVAEHLKVKWCKGFPLPGDQCMTGGEVTT